MSQPKNKVQYEKLGARGSALKMRARTLETMGVADEQEQWEVVLSYHQAARMELEALSLIDRPSPMVETLHRTEAMGLFLRSGDLRSATAQSVLLPKTDDVAVLRMQADALKKVAKLISTFRDRYDRVRSKPTLRSVLSMLKTYPGVAQLWWLRFRLAAEQQDYESCRLSAQRARELDPDNPRFAAAFTMMAPKMFSRTVAIKQCRAELDRWGNQSPEVLIGVSAALAYLHTQRAGNLLDESEKLFARANRLPATKKNKDIAQLISVLRTLILSIKEHKPKQVLQNNAEQIIITAEELVLRDAA